MKKTGIYLVVILFMLSVFSPLAYAEYANGDVIFAEDLSVGAILTGFTVSGNGSNNQASEAIVVRSGQSPRLVLTSNHGNSTSFGSTYNYNYSNLKSRIDDLSFSINFCIANVSAPHFNDLVGGSWSSSTMSDGYYFSSSGRFVSLYELNGNYWTATHWDGSIFYVTSDGLIEGRNRGSGGNVRPAFNLKSDTVLKFNSSNKKWTVTTNSTDIVNAHYRKYGELYSAAASAKSSADVAATNATQAKSAADNAANRSWYTGTYGGNPESAADLAGYIRSKQYLVVKRHDVGRLYHIMPFLLLISCVPTP